MRLIECVPNISEGRDPAILRQISAALNNIPDIHLFEFEMGRSANRSVLTIVGTPEAVEAAAFEVARIALTFIDMSRQSGVHPRIGALDVCPFIPLHNTTISFCSELAKRFAKRLAEAFQIPVFLYAAASSKSRRIIDFRRGGYEQLMKAGQLEPDFGPILPSPRSGASIVGARNMMLAYNINLATKDVSIADRIAKRLRETGRKIRKEDGSFQHIPGLFKSLQAIGWYIDEFNCAQVSMNILDVNAVPLAELYRAAGDLASQFGTQVTGSEVVGMIPRSMLLKAGEDFMTSGQVDESKRIRIAIKELGLNDVVPFVPEQKILDIEQLITKKGKQQNG